MPTEAPRCTFDFAVAVPSGGERHNFACRRGGPSAFCGRPIEVLWRAIEAGALRGGIGQSGVPV